MQGGATHPQNLPKGPLLVTKWAKNGVFVRELRGWGSKSTLFGSKRSTFWGSCTPKIDPGYEPDCIYLHNRPALTVVIESQLPWFLTAFIESQMKNKVGLCGIKQTMQIYCKVDYPIQVIRSNFLGQI